MPPRLQRRVSLHDLKQTVDEYNAANSDKSETILSKARENALLAGDLLSENRKLKTEIGSQAARIAELENRYRSLIPGDAIQEWDEVFVSGDWMLVGEEHHGMMIHTPNATTRRRIGKDRPLESQRNADAKADGKPDGQAENAIGEARADNATSPKPPTQ